MKIYIAGRIHKDRSRFGIVNDIARHGDKYHKAEFVDFNFDGRKLTYTGPFTVGCDHACAHAYDHAVGPSCDRFFFDDDAPLEGHGMKDFLRYFVVEKSIAGIQAADFVFAWFGDESEHAYGTIAEIGCARGMCKPIYIGCNPFDSTDTWFAKTMANKLIVADDAKSALKIALDWHDKNPSKF